MFCTKGVRGQKVPRVSGDKRCQGCQSLKGAKGVRGKTVLRVKSSEGLLGGRVFSRTNLRSSLTPAEGPSCYTYILIMGTWDFCCALDPDDSPHKELRLAAAVAVAVDDTLLVWPRYSL